MSAITAGLPQLRLVEIGCASAILKIRQVIPSNYTQRDTLLFLNVFFGISFT